MNEAQIFLCGLIVGSMLGMGWGYAAGLQSGIKKTLGGKWNDND